MRTINATFEDKNFEEISKLKKEIKIKNKLKNFSWEEFINLLFKEYLIKRNY